MNATDRTRMPVVLLHALALHSSMWDAQRRALTALGHPVIAPDQRGFGSAPLGDAPPSLDVVADDLARLLDGRGVDRAVIAGASMGGYTAMAFLARHPDRVAGLALLSARATADTPEAAAQRRKFARLVRLDEARGPLVDRSSALLVGTTTRAERPDVLRRVTADARAADPAALAWAQLAIAARPDSTGTLRTARVPAVVIAGEEDELVPHDDARHAADALPHGRLITLPKAGHLPPLETPEAVTAALRELLHAVDPSDTTDATDATDTAEKATAAGENTAAGETGATEETEVRAC
ncbi:alpha/beta fold hydrolase [Streptomyces sp. NPDC051310]|uniref:alpha/beta fold hydrolase n=1 Tax=Streptomyces sp. NPDC051310 TaxID=3365649 RepID=UPI0037A5E3FA